MSDTIPQNIAQMGNQHAKDFYVQAQTMLQVTRAKQGDPMAHFSAQDIARLQKVAAGYQDIVVSITQNDIGQPQIALTTKKEIERSGGKSIQEAKNVILLDNKLQDVTNDAHILPSTYNIPRGIQQMGNQHAMDFYVQAQTMLQVTQAKKDDKKAPFSEHDIGRLQKVAADYTDLAVKFLKDEEGHIHIAIAPKKELTVAPGQNFVQAAHVAMFDDRLRDETSDDVFQRLGRGNEIKSYFPIIGDIFKADIEKSRDDLKTLTATVKGMLKDGVLDAGEKKELNNKDEELEHIKIKMNKNNVTVASTLSGGAVMFGGKPESVDKGRPR